MENGLVCRFIEYVKFSSSLTEKIRIKMSAVLTGICNILIYIYKKKYYLIIYNSRL